MQDLGEAGLAAKGFETGIDLEPDQGALSGRERGFEPSQRDGLVPQSGVDAGDLRGEGQTAIGKTLLKRPLFLNDQMYVHVPLETTYQSAYRGMPQFWREILEQPQPG